LQPGGCREFDRRWQWRANAKKGWWCCRTS
jgi:hypothetical protein